MTTDHMTELAAFAERGRGGADVIGMLVAVVLFVVLVSGVFSCSSTRLKPLEAPGVVEGAN